MSEHVAESRDGDVLVLRLNRPEKKNALTVEMYAALADALHRAADDDSVGAVLLTGTGDAFTGGNDVIDFLQRPPQDESSPVLRFLLALVDCPRPVAAAVNGLAIGIGTTLLLHCDLVYAARSARFAMPFAPLGLVPEAGSSLLVPRLVGNARAAELLLMGESVGADEARAMGIVGAVYPDEELMPRTMERLTRLSGFPRSAVLRSKELIRGGDREAVRARIREEAALFLQQLRSPETQAALQAALTRR